MGVSYKCWGLFLICVLACSMTCSAEKTNDTELVEKIAREIAENREDEARRTKLEEEKEIKEQFTYTFNDVVNNLVIIEHEFGSGSGFVVTMDGKRYILTNQHMILGVNKITFKTLNGEQLRPRKVELATSRDMARLLLEDGPGLEIASMVDMGVPIAIYGNSQGAGVATELYGKVTGIGADILEVSADFVKGNSGSPVLDKDMKVVGLASYIRLPRKTSDTEGTRFENQTRRFGTRITGAEWLPVSWKKYNETHGKAFHDNYGFVNDVVSILSEIGQVPPEVIVCRKEMDAELSELAGKHNKSLKNYSASRSIFSRTDNSRFFQKRSSNLKDLTDICRQRSGKIRRFINLRSTSEDYVRSELEDNIEMLESIADFLQQMTDI